MVAHETRLATPPFALPASPSEEEAEDRTAADYLLFLASSPSPSSIKRFSSDADTDAAATGVLATPAHTSLWDPFGEPRSRTTTQRGEPLTPPPSARKPAAAGVAGGSDTPRDAHEYMATRTPRSPRTPPPSTLRNSGCFEVGTPAAPGGDTNFHYADFVNVSPSPQPPSTGRFAATYAPRGELRTPTKINRHRFERPS
ncbi:hypothetical protein L1887_47165 [Cichorium endivia]|nr:hypothetical protein L1887_47165 [Cichorium endivia]